MLRKLNCLLLATKIKNAIIIALFFFCGFINVVYAIDLSKVSQVYFFGDSLTDGGFNDLWPTEGIPGQPLPAGKAPTFTTYGGYTWAQYLAHDIKGYPLPVYPGPSIPDLITNNTIYPVPSFVSATLAGINYAAAGSTTNSIGFSETWAPSLHQQVTHFLQTWPAGQSLDPNALYFIWEGANDFLTLLFQPTLPTQLELLQTAQTAAINIANDVARLSARGAKRIVVMSLPNLGLAPLATNFGIPSLPALLKNLSFTFNSMLNTQLGYVIASYGIKVLYVDTYTLIDNVVSATKAGQAVNVAGQSFKFTNYSDPACATVSSAIYCPSGTPSGYIFADLLHPTDMSHRVISLEVETLLQNWA